MVTQMFRIKHHLPVCSRTPGKDMWFCSHSTVSSLDDRNPVCRHHIYNTEVCPIEVQTNELSSFEPHDPKNEHRLLISQ